jgi:hypothetical protein
MAINFDNVEYLKVGTIRQQQAYSTLTNNQILSKLMLFDPILVGTIPIDIDIENSDLDIICCFDDGQKFQSAIMNYFKEEENFKITEKKVLATLTIVANFVVDNFEIEIFGQSIPSKQQFAYRHLIAEHNLLNKYGDKFRQNIIDLKRQGHKTEPAFGIALGLTGDPYIELLKFETNDKSPNR